MEIGSVETPPQSSPGRYAREGDRSLVPNLVEFPDQMDDQSPFPSEGEGRENAVLPLAQPQKDLVKALPQTLGQLKEAPYSQI